MVHVPVLLMFPFGWPPPVHAEASFAVDPQVLGSTIAFFGLVFAGSGLLQNAAQMRRSATFAHIREIQEKVGAIRSVDPHVLRKSILAFF